MSSPSFNVFHGTFTGAAATITVAKVPFRPRAIKFWFTGGGTGIKVDGEEGMDGANYLSNTGADVGVTITDNGFTVASGADVNSSGNPVTYEVIG
jgi:hypothetical protein